MMQVYPHFVLFGVGYLASLFFAQPGNDIERFTIYGYLARRRARKINESAAIASPIGSGS